MLCESKYAARAHNVTGVGWGRSDKKASQATQIGVERLRPWETGADSPCLPSVDFHEQPLQPFGDDAELEEAGRRIFARVHSDFGGYFQSMRQGFLYLASRPNKTPGGYMNSFPISGKDYIFMNAVGTHRNFRTLMHEADAMSGSTPIRNENRTQTHLMPTDSRRLS